MVDVHHCVGNNIHFWKRSGTFCCGPTYLSQAYFLSRRNTVTSTSKRTGKNIQKPTTNHRREAGGKRVGGSNGWALMVGAGERAVVAEFVIVIMGGV